MIDKTLRVAFAALLVLGVSSARATVVPLAGVTPQSAPARSAFPHAVAVLVSDASRAPAAGATVVLTVSPQVAVAGSDGTTCALGQPGIGNGLDPSRVRLVCTVTADASGIARFPPLQAQFAGSYVASIEAWAANRSLGSADIALTATPRATPAVLVVTSGDYQSVVLGTTLPRPVKVELTTADGEPLAGVIGYAPVAGALGGFLPNADTRNQVATDGLGEAILPPLTAGCGVGDMTASATYVDENAAAYVTATLHYHVTNAFGSTDLRFQDLWWSGPAQNGWGMSVVQHGKQLFNVYFVYDRLGNPTWYVQSGGSWSGGFGCFFWSPIYRPSGSPWWAYDASRFSIGAPVGNAQLAFQGEDSGRLTMTNSAHSSLAPAPSLDQPVVRLEFGTGPDSAMRGVGDMWWGGPSQNGWGISIEEQRGSLFLVWFTYDESWHSTWFVMPDGHWIDDRTFGGTIYRTHGTPATMPYSPSDFSATPAGTFTLRFDSSLNHASFDFNLDGRSGTLALERLPF